MQGDGCGESKADDRNEVSGSYRGEQLEQCSLVSAFMGAPSTTVPVILDTVLTRRDSAA